MMRQLSQLRYRPSWTAAGFLNGARRISATRRIASLKRDAAGRLAGARCDLKHLDDQKM